MRFHAAASVTRFQTRKKDALALMAGIITTLALATGLASINAIALASEPAAMPALDSTRPRTNDAAAPSFVSSGQALTNEGKAQAGFAPGIPGCDPEWTVVPSPNEGASHNKLWAVAAFSSSDVWAVGHYLSSNVERTLTEHWDGSAWSVVSSPNVGSTNDNYLIAVDALSSSDVWTVGYYESGTIERTLIEHWDGNTWSVVSSPNVGTGENYLTGVAALSPSDVWAVGYYFPGGTAFQTLTLHWDGTTWSIVPSPNAGNNFLTGVAAVSPSDVWAVGYYLAGTLYQTLTLHWDGATWSVVPGDNIGSDGSFLLGVSAISNSDVWAVGYYIDGFTWNTLTEHWNGSAWSVVPSPDVGTVQNFLLGVSAISPSDVWAVGHYYIDNVDFTLIEHWNGSAWSVAPSPSPGLLGNQLNGIASVSAGDVWAVGYDITDTTYHTLVERYNPCQGTPTPTSITTNTPGPATATPTIVPTNTSTYTRTPGPTSPPPSPSATLTETPTVPPTRTPGGSTATPVHTSTNTNTPLAPTNTPTPCPIQFTDVPANHTFYPFIRCLACRGIVSGYADGAYGANNGVTRGQIAKIVSNATGFSENHTDQSFQDIPPSHAFYIYIERLASRGIISGYACGAVGEPCIPPLDRPYFRSGANATRGQLSKIICLAYGCTGVPGGQTFEDVPPSHTFYIYIQQLFALGAINGYTCGLPPAGPCIPPLDRPYFLPANNVTRGQTAKIVSNVYFPECYSPARR